MVLKRLITRESAADLVSESGMALKVPSRALPVRRDQDLGHRHGARGHLPHAPGPMPMFLRFGKEEPHLTATGYSLGAIGFPMETVQRVVKDRHQDESRDGQEDQA